MEAYRGITFIIGSFALACCLAMATLACKGNSTTPAPPKPVQVTVTATFFNHTKGTIGEKTYSGQSGGLLIIKATDVSAGNVDKNRIVVREPASGGYLGKLIGFSRNGEVQTTFPGQNGDYSVFLMNLGPTTSWHYGKIDEWIDKGPYGVLAFSPVAKWYRKDWHGGAGPEAPINDAFADLNDAIKYSWVKYGSLDKVASGGNFAVGYDDAAGGAWGYHTGSWAGVDLKRCGYNKILMLRVFLAEIFEIVTNTADLGGDNTLATITNSSTGHLNEIGRDLFAYVHVKDEKTVSSSSKSKFSIGFMR